MRRPVAVRHTARIVRVPPEISRGPCKLARVRKLRAHRWGVALMFAGRHQPHRAGVTSEARPFQSRTARRDRLAEAYARAAKERALSRGHQRPQRAPDLEEYLSTLLWHPVCLAPGVSLLPVAARPAPVLPFGYR